MGDKRFPSTRSTSEALTIIENECHDVLEMIRDWIWEAHTKKRVWTSSYMAVMGEIVKTLKHIDNKIYGCSSGLHSGNCYCRGGRPGRSKHSDVKRVS